MVLTGISHPAKFCYKCVWEKQYLYSSKIQLNAPTCTCKCAMKVQCTFTSPGLNPTAGSWQTQQLIDIVLPEPATILKKALYWLTSSVFTQTATNQLLLLLSTCSTGNVIDKHVSLCLMMTINFFVMILIYKLTKHHEKQQLFLESR